MPKTGNLELLGHVLKHSALFKGKKCKRKNFICNKGRNNRQILDHANFAGPGTARVLNFKKLGVAPGPNHVSEHWQETKDHLCTKILDLAPDVGLVKVICIERVSL